MKLKTHIKAKKQVKVKVKLKVNVKVNINVKVKTRSRSWSWTGWERYKSASRGWRGRRKQEATEEEEDPF